MTGTLRRARGIVAWLAGVAVALALDPAAAWAAAPLNDNYLASTQMMRAHGTVTRAYHEVVDTSSATVQPDLLDPAAFGEWVDGAERPTTSKRGPAHVVWMAGSQIEWQGLRFGDSKTSGPRHLRVGIRGVAVVIPRALFRRAGCDSPLLGPTLRLSKRQRRPPGDRRQRLPWRLRPQPPTRAGRRRRTGTRRTGHATFFTTAPGWSVGSNAAQACRVRSR